MTRRLPVLAALAAATLAPAAADDSLIHRWDHPRRESFDMKGFSPRGIAEVISRRYGVPIECEDASATDPTTFQATDVTFFEALDRLAAAQRLSIIGVPAAEVMDGVEPLTLRRPRHPLGTAPVAHLGPSRLSVQGLVTGKALAFTAELPRVGKAWSDLKGEKRMQVVLKWMVEPGLEDVMLLRVKVAAQDDAKRPLTVVPRFEFMDPPDNDSYDLPLEANRNFSVYFDPPRPEAVRIGKLVVDLKVALPAELSEVEFLAKDVGTKKQLGGCRVTLVALKDARVEFAFDGTPCPEVVPSGTFASSDTGKVSIDQMAVVAFDAKGEPIECGGRSGGTADGTSATYWTEWEEAPARFAVRAITKVVLKGGRCAFSDIPLPE